MTTPPVTVADLLREQAATHPTAVALRVGDATSLTYEQWDRRSDATARGLVSRGIRPGQRVALLFDNERWADYAVCYLAVIKAGAVVVPLGSRFAGPELQQVLAHADASGVVCAKGLHPPVTGAWVAESPELDEGWEDGGSFGVPVRPDDLAEILYTSGTTGMPKGVACSHLSIMAHDVPPDAVNGPVDRPISFLHCFPIGTQAGQETLRVPLRIQGRVVVAVARFDPEHVCSLVARYGVARLQLVPTMAQLLAVSGAHRRHDVSSVKRVILSSAHAPPALFRRLAEVFPEASLWNAYALTEAGSARTLMCWDESRPTSVGIPVGRTEVQIVGDGRALPAGDAGEVWLRREDTPNREYYRDPTATSAAFVDGWVRTGDIGHLDGDGYLYLDDRKKDLIISGGSNVSSAEVEDTLCEHPAVLEAAVFGVSHAVLGEDVGAAVIVGSATTERALSDFVRSRLAEYKVPHRIVLVEDLPRNASGKVLKGDLRHRFGQEGGAATRFQAARGPLEAEVARIWEEVLKRPMVGVHDDFFAIGGTSLAAAQIVARLQDALGVCVGLGAVFESPTVAELAVALEKERSTTEGLLGT